MFGFRVQGLGFGIGFGFFGLSFGIKRMPSCFQDEPVALTSQAGSQSGLTHLLRVMFRRLGYTSLLGIQLLRFRR